MTNFIPVFPLAMVVYPTELVNLHIFEPRYKQLIADSVNTQKPFGMATTINGQLQDFGCTVTIVNITKTYDSGEMDLTIQGQDVIKILDFLQEVPNKMYSGAIVNYPQNNFSTSNKIKLQKIQNRLTQAFAILEINKVINPNKYSYNYAHYIGLTLAQQHELLTLLTEDERLDYVTYYLQKMLTNNFQKQNVLDKVKLNGHFRLNK